MSEKSYEPLKRMMNCLPEDVREHMQTAKDEIKAGYRSLLPPEFIQHRKTARRELLLAARSLLDRAIESLE